MTLPREIEDKFVRVLTLLLNHGYQETADHVRDIRDYCSARTEVAPSIPEGWKLVPKKPTEEMVRAAHEQTYVDTRISETASIIRAEWREMLKAAPRYEPQSHQESPTKEK